MDDHLGSTRLSQRTKPLSPPARSPAYPTGATYSPTTVGMTSLLARLWTLTQPCPVLVPGSLGIPPQTRAGATGLREVVRARTPSDGGH